MKPLREESGIRGFFACLLIFRAESEATGR